MKQIAEQLKALGFAMPEQVLTAEIAEQIEQLNEAPKPKYGFHDISALDLAASPKQFKQIAFDLLMGSVERLPDIIHRAKRLPVTKERAALIGHLHRVQEVIPAVEAEHMQVFLKRAFRKNKPKVGVPFTH